MLSQMNYISTFNNNVVLVYRNTCHSALRVLLLWHLNLDAYIKSMNFTCNRIFLHCGIATFTLLSF